MTAEPTVHTERPTPDLPSPHIEQEVEFLSAGDVVAATLRLPAGRKAQDLPAIIQGPGWLGLRDAKLYAPYHAALLAAGFAVLVLDYRGFGSSGGNPFILDPRAQVEDIRAGVSYLEACGWVDPTRIGAFGSGGTGGGNAIMAAGFDGRIAAVVSQVPIADGQQWLRGMRSESEWSEFIERVELDRRKRVLGGKGERVSPRHEITVPSPERRTTTVKADVDQRVPAMVELSSAQAVMDYRPLDVVERISPRALMLICVEGDDTTPESHAFDLFHRARSPKRLLVQTGTTHYRAYADFVDVMPGLIAAWFERFLNDRPGPDDATSDIEYMSAIR